MVYNFDLTKPELAYMFGFLQTDGCLRKGKKNKGNLLVEIQVKDRLILEKFKELVSVYSSIRERTRNTNFKKNYTSAIWSVYDLEFRTALNELGLPYGKKSTIISTPTVPFSEIDYWRGIIDGDGSLGITAQNFPFMSLITTSDSLKNSFLQFLFEKTNQLKTTQPNKRDNAYNIVIKNENAQQLINELYYPGCLCLERKRASAELVKSWVRPDNIPKRTFETKRWTADEDALVLSLPYKEAMEKLGRTEQSVKTRLWRLKNNKI